MSVPSIDKIRELGFFATSNTWDIEIEDFSGEKGFVTNLRAKSCEIPKISIPKLTANIVGLKTNQPGVGDYSGSIVAVFYETEKAEVSEYIRKWRLRLWNREGGGHYAITPYKRKVTLNRLDRAGQNPVYQYVLHGCYPSEFEIGTFDDDDKLVEAKVTFTYDLYEEG